jgi:23S rRNA (guanine1835-N2)-methyltransferase
MRYLTDLFAQVASKVKPPVCVVLGPPRPVAYLVETLGGVETVCYQMDLHQANRLREALAEARVTAEVVVHPDLWDLPARFNTVIFPASAHSDRELKLDVIEQSFHILEPGGIFLTLSEYEKDSLFAKAQKKVFGRCSETPSSEHGMAFWSKKSTGAEGEHGKAERPRRRHEVEYHAKLADGPSMNFLTRPGTFSYGRFDAGSRAMIEIADVREGDHVLDLGCGNGAVGCLMSTKAGPKGRVTLIDSNLRSMALAEMNAKANNVTNTTFLSSTRLEGLKPNSYDVILANPPYYARSEITRMFIDGARDLLKRGGRYYIVTKMPTEVVPMIFETFGDCATVENRGYVVIIAEA